MNKIFFIGDSHFGHSNILKFESFYRPFNDLEEMHETLIERWNSVVKKGDTVYHLGDFAFGNQNLRIAERLNGDKRLILGNHDTAPSLAYCKHFTKLYGVHSVHGYILTHVPVANQKHRFKGNIHGHLHSKLMDDPWYFNVSTEQLNHCPIEFDKLNSLHERANKLGVFSDEK